VIASPGLYRRGRLGGLTVLVTVGSWPSACSNTSRVASFSDGVGASALEAALQGACQNANEDDHSAGSSMPNSARICAPVRVSPSSLIS
jgi:hypothetical protein